MTTAQPVNVSAPPRTMFPLPYHATFDDQPVPAPGRYLSDAWGSFEVFASPDGNHVLRQSAPACPIGWRQSALISCSQLPPFTTLPSGTNWMNYNVSVRASLAPTNQTGALASLCGRIGIWPLRNERLRMSPPMGVCLVINRTHWSLVGWLVGCLID